MPELARQPAGMQGVNAGTCCAQLLLRGTEPLPAPVPCCHPRSKAPTCCDWEPPTSTRTPTSTGSPPQALSTRGEVQGGRDAGLAPGQDYQLGCGWVCASLGSCPSCQCARSCRICFGANQITFFGASILVTHCPQAWRCLGRHWVRWGGCWGTRGGRGTLGVGGPCWLDRDTENPRSSSLTA